jgi:hypothetical protein
MVLLLVEVWPWMPAPLAMVAVVALVVGHWPVFFGLRAHVKFPSHACAYLASYSMALMSHSGRFVAMGQEGSKRVTAQTLKRKHKDTQQTTNDRLSTTGADNRVCLDFRTT